MKIAVIKVILVFLVCSQENYCADNVQYHFGYVGLGQKHARPSRVPSWGPDLESFIFPPSCVLFYGFIMELF